MTIRISDGLRCSLMGDAFLKGTSLSYNDNGGDPDTITDSENRFLEAGFKVGDAITTTGSTTGGNDISDVVLTVVAAGTLTFVTGTLAATEDFIAATTLTGNNGGDFKALFTDAVMEIYSGSQPSDPNEAETGTKLLRITIGSGAFTPGAAGNGLEFKPVSEGILSKNDDEVWSGVGLANGTAGWFRLYDNLYHTGAVASAVRLDGSVGTSGANAILTSTAIKLDATTTLDKFNVRFPTSP
jgi:hypothetical protein